MAFSLIYNTIPNTLLANSTPLGLGQGFSLFPTIIPKPSPLGVHLARTIFSYDRTILGFRSTAEASVSLFFGVLGPSWATQVNVTGRHGPLIGPATVYRTELTTSNDQLIAGLIAGASTTLAFNCSIHLVFRKLDLNFNLTIDLIGICVTLINLALGGKGLLAKVADKLPSIPASWGAYDATSDSYAANGGRLSVSPNFQIPINLYSLLVLADRTTGVFSGVLIGVDALLSATLSSITVGPTIGLGVRVQVSVTSIVVSSTSQFGDFPDVVYSGANLKIDAARRTFYGESSTLMLGPTVTRVGMGFSQTPFFDLSLGFTAQLTVLQIFSVGASFSFSILKALGINIPLGGPYPASLSNQVGKTTVSMREVEFA